MRTAGDEFAMIRGSGLVQWLIHRSAWKGNSANFAITEFSEVRQELSKHHSFEGCVGLRERYIIPVGKANSLGEAEKELIVLWHGT
jgi:hypothetical protein